jgi:hypothetical protein
MCPLDQQAKLYGGSKQKEAGVKKYHQVFKQKQAC